MQSLLRSFLPAVLISGLLISSLHAEPVKLTNTEGREIEAELVSLEEDIVEVRVKPHGVIPLKLDQLSEASQKLVINTLDPTRFAPENPGKLILAKELVIEDALNESTWSEHWKGGMGDFYPKADHVVGVEDPSENHSAGAGRRQEMSSAIIEVEFRYDESTQMGIVIDYKADTGNKYDNQHVMKLQIRDGKFGLFGGTGWSDQTRRTKVGDMVDVELVEGWNTVVLEFHGQEMAGHLNGELITFGSTEEPIQAPKNQITLTAHGTVSYRNLKMWSGEMQHPEWEVGQTNTQDDS